MGAHHGTFIPLMSGKKCRIPSIKKVSGGPKRRTLTETSNSVSVMRYRANNPATRSLNSIGVTSPAATGAPTFNPTRL